ncbi:MAG: amidase, partial [Bacillota bacterium]
MYHYMTVSELAQRIKKREVSAEETTRSFIERIEELDEKVGAYITVEKDRALKTARDIDKKLKQGCELSPLAGIPMALKDNICTENIRTTCASKTLEDFVPPYSADVYERLEKAGCITLGKTNMDEFAMGSSTESSAFKVTRNPWDDSSIPGDSSGGSAAAVAAGMAAFALGTDTGGSIRQPAAL